MKKKKDIKSEKAALRLIFRERRRSIEAQKKQLCDDKIFSRIISSRHYKSCNTLLTYVSFADETDTLRLIEYALKDGKRVAVPKCSDKKGIMDFYVIKSTDDLIKGKFSLSEPDPERCTVLKKFRSALCIIPGLAFDMDGYRLGYGGGYYDRFLSKYPNIHKMGICSCVCTVQHLVKGAYDSRLNTLVTEKYLKTFT